MLLTLATAGSASEPVPPLVVRRQITNKTTAIPSSSQIPAGFYEGTSRVSHIVRNHGKDLRLTFSNEDASPMELRASLSTPGTRRVTFSGATTVTIPTGGTVTSDIVAVSVKPGQTIYTQTYVKRLGETWGGWQGAFTLNPEAGEWTTRDDQSAPGGVGAGVNLLDRATRAPTRIEADAPVDAFSLAIGGDSISVWTPETFPVLAAEKQKIAWTSYGRGGEAIILMPSRKGPRYGPNGLSKYTHYLCQYGYNDLASHGGGDFSMWVEYWDWVVTQGPKVMQTTITPSPTTSDNWATLSGQAVPSSDARRVPFNTWLRDGAPINNATRIPMAVGSAGAVRAGQVGHPLQRVIDVASIVESSLNSGKYRLDMGPIGNDGLHFSPTVHHYIADRMGPICV